MITIEKLKIGTFLQGGIYIGDLGGYHIIASPKKWESLCQYRSENTANEFSTSQTDGWKNTLLMQEKNQDLFYAIKTGKVHYPAANYCCQLNIDGYSDWYLPSKEELNLLWENRDNIPLNERNTATGYWPENGRNTATGYWSSSEGSTNYSAWRQSFVSGFQVICTKTNFFRVRAFRKILKR